MWDKSPCPKLCIENKIVVDMNQHDDVKGPFFFTSEGPVVYWFVCLMVFNATFNDFQQYFSYIVAVSFIGGGNRSICRKASTCRKSLANFIT
jgi:hypothetical protein